MVLARLGIGSTKSCERETDKCVRRMDERMHFYGCSKVIGEGILLHNRSEVIKTEYRRVN